MYNGIVYLGCIFIVFLGFNILSNLKLNEIGTIYGYNYNIIAYILVLLLTSIFSILCIMLHKNAINKHRYIGKQTKNRWNIIMTVTFLLGASYLIIFYNTENNVYPGPGVNFLRLVVKVHYVYLIFIIILSILLTLLIIYCAQKIPKYIRKLLAIFISLVCSCLTFAPNCYMDQGGTLYHIDAYVNSIINVLRYEPYSSFNTCIYGHYGIFYLPLVKLFELFLGRYQSIAAAISLITFATFLCAIYVCDKLIANDIVFTISSTAICGMIILLYWNGQYYQVNPHRLFSVMVMLAFIAHNLSKEHNNRINLLAFIICTISIDWNLELGLISTATYVLYRVIRRKLTIHNKRHVLISSILLGALYIFLAFLTAYLIVCIYNIAVGSNQLLKLNDFIYPFGKNEYSVDSLRLPLPSGCTLYILQIAVFIISIVNSALYFTNHENYDINIYSDRIHVLQSCIAFSGIGAITYFINRAAYANISITWIQMILILGIIADRLPQKFGTKLKSDPIVASGCTIGAIFLSALGVETVMNLNGAFMQRATSVWDTSTMAEFAETIEKNVPRNTFAIGNGTAELYWILDWDPQIACTDFPDMNDTTREYIKDKLKDQELIFVSNDLLDDELLNGYIVKETYTIGSYGFSLCQSIYLHPTELNASQKITFGSDNNLYNADQYIIQGFSDAESSFTWIDSDKALLIFHNDTNKSEYTCNVNISSVYRQQSLSIYVNGTLCYESESQQTGIVTFQIPVADDGNYIIDFETPDVQSPAENGDSGDTRTLSIAISSINFK